MNRITAVLLGLLTCWPLIYLVYFFGFMFSMVFSIMWPGRAGGAADPAARMGQMFILHLLTMLVLAVLLVIYICYLFQTDRVARDKKPLWAVALFLGNMIAMPVFWYLYVWRQLPRQTAEPEQTPSD